MHHDWRLHDYPFDIHTLSMEMELVDTSYDDIRFVTSSIIPVLDESLEVPKWSVIGGSVYATKESDLALLVILRWGEYLEEPHHCWRCPWW